MNIQQLPPEVDPTNRDRRDFIVAQRLMDGRGRRCRDRVDLLYQGLIGLIVV